MNRLKDERSPYLLQHKDNPVEWYSWGSEALDRAKKENKPLFISIGYSTCHWCHVMNRESFSDREVADILNKYFIPIKVDKEERPDIDKVYMEFSQAMTGGGGWPLNILATPEGRPFITITYLPKNSKRGMIGLIEYLNKIKDLWEYDYERIIRESRLIFEQVKKISSDIKEGDIDEEKINTAKEALKKIYDDVNGGFGNRPKFPMPQYLLYLLKYGDERRDELALEMAEKTLENMYKGGIFDHIGYGFFRYSTDEKWLVPHFEKMLYDNALLSLVYTKAYELTGKDLYKEVADKVFEFIIRDMISPEGGFYSALDADSEGAEGKFYLFSKKEIVNLLGEEWGETFTHNYDITEKGNFEGENIANLIGKDLKEVKSRENIALDSMIDMLFTYREKRIKPHRDEKILTSWNGLMIGSLAYGGNLFDNKFYIKKAKEAADFILKNSIDKEGNLLSVNIGGKSYNLGYLDDYSFFIYGLLNLYKANGEEEYLEKAIKLMDKSLELFQDKEDSGMYFYSDISEELVLRPKDLYDGAIPSGVSFILIDLIKLYLITKEEKYSLKAREIVHSFGKNINENPLAHLYSIVSLGDFI